MVPSFPASIGQSAVKVVLDSSHNTSCISAALVHKLDLPCSFGEAGVQYAIANLHLPTDDGCYQSRLILPVSYGLPSDLILGDDWVAPCKPVMSDDRSRLLKPHPSTVDSLPPPHSWYPKNGSFPRLCAFVSHS